MICKVSNIILGVLTLLFTVSCKYQNVKNQEKKTSATTTPNIIFLLTDDLRHDALGFMGNNHVKTPQLDQLASEGVIFKNAYHVAPICLPSRASIMLGQYLGTHGAGFDRPSNMLVTEGEFARSYPVLLRENGYHTGFIGKFGFPVKGNKKIISENLEHELENLPVDAFDVWNGFPGQGSYLPKTDSFNGYSNKWKAKHLNEFMGYQALDFIVNAKNYGRPFCLSLSFKAPHSPFLPEKDMRLLYDDKNIPRMYNDDPKTFEKLPSAIRTKSRNALRYFGKVDGPSWHLYQEDNYQAFIKNYYALI